MYVNNVIGVKIKEKFFLGIDGGGTKTEFALVSADGQVMKSVRKKGCNPNDIGYSKCRDLIVDGINEFFLEYPSLKNIFCGISGIMVGDYSQRLQDELGKNYPGLNIQVKSDACNLFATCDEADMAVISGTGSVVLVRNSDNYNRIGGWGHLLDRAGSAYDIGRDAICLALKEEDMQEKHSYISKKLCEKFGTHTVWNNLNTIYSEGKSYIAKLAPVVFEAYISLI